MLGLTSCGDNSNPTGNTYTVIIHVNYKESLGFNYRDDAKLYVDDIEIGDVPYGSDSNYELTLTEGTHTIYLKRDALFRKYNTNLIEVDVLEENTYISIIAQENAISGLRIYEDSSSKETTTISPPANSSNMSENSESIDDNDTSNSIFDSFAEGWNRTDVPSDIANHAFELAIKLYIQQYYIPEIMPHTSYEYIMENDILVWEPIELVESAQNPGYYNGTMNLWFNPNLEEVGWDFKTTENFEYSYDLNTSYITIFSKSWETSWNLFDADATNDPNHMTLNMTPLPSNVIFDVAEASCLYYIENIVLPNEEMSSFDEFISKGCAYEYDREGYSGIRVIQIGDISYSLTMGVYVDATIEEERRLGFSSIYYDEITMFFEVENIGKENQSLTGLYFSVNGNSRCYKVLFFF